MLQIIYAALAFFMLYGDRDAEARKLGGLQIQPLCAAFVTLTIQDEIVGPGEVWGFGNFDTEVAGCRQRIAQLEGTPRMVEGMWLPCEKLCRANYHFALSLSWRFDLLADLEPHRKEHWEALARDCDRRASIWNMVSLFRPSGTCIVSQRRNLHELRERIGHENWANMKIPDSVPLESLPRMD